MTRDKGFCCRLPARGMRQPGYGIDRCLQRIGHNRSLFTQLFTLIRYTTGGDEMKEVAKESMHGIEVKRNSKGEVNMDPAFFHGFTAT